MRTPVLAGLGNACFDAVTQNVPFKFGEHSQHSGKSPTAWSRQIEGLAQRDKTNIQRDQFLQRSDEIGERPPPAVESPHEDGINLFSTRGAEQFVTARTGRSAGTDFLDLGPCG